MYFLEMIVMEEPNTIVFVHRCNYTQFPEIWITCFREQSKWDSWYPYQITDRWFPYRHKDACYSSESGSVHSSRLEIPSIRLVFHTTPSQNHLLETRQIRLQLIPTRVLAVDLLPKQVRQSALTVSDDG